MFALLMTKTDKDVTLVTTVQWPHDVKNVLIKWTKQQGAVLQMCSAMCLG